MCSEVLWEGAHSSFRVCELKASSGFLFYAMLGKACLPVGTLAYPKGATRTQIIDGIFVWPPTPRGPNTQSQAQMRGAS